jgi:Tfp pilus assembly protein PilW
VKQRRAARGSTLVDLLVGTALGLGVLGALSATVGTGARLLAASTARGEAEDTAQLAVEAFLFDLRRAGFDAAGAGVTALREASPTRLALEADLDGDGAVDPESEETITWICAPAAHRLSRLVGRQSMPLADGVTRCALAYYDAAGEPILAAGASLSPAERARARAVSLEMALRLPGLGGEAARRVRIALRGIP